jgi:DNA-binding beta-propeller fold protein YncE
MLRKRMTLTALLALAAWACGTRRDLPPAAPVGLANSVDGKYTYVPEADRDVVTVLHRKRHSKVAEVPVGKAPEQVAVAPDDTVYVANRGSRSISVIRRDSWHEAGRIPAGLEPVALAVARDNRTLYVVNGSSLDQPDVGTLMAVDLSTQTVRWELPLQGEPRGISLLDETRARIPLYRSAQPLIVDLVVPLIVGQAPAEDRANQAALHASLSQ